MRYLVKRKNAKLYQTAQESAAELVFSDEASHKHLYLLTRYGFVKLMVQFLLIN